MTAFPEFTFNEKTGELSRGGRALTFRSLPGEVFAALAKAHHQGCRVSSDHIRRCLSFNVTAETIDAECREIAYRIRSLGISIAVDANGLRWLSFGEVPKWKPSVPPPVCLPGESIS